MEDAKDIVAGFLVILGFATIFFLFPILVIWCINTLFGTKIAITFLNWLAMLVLILVFSGRTPRPSGPT